MSTAIRENLFLLKQPPPPCSIPRAQLGEFREAINRHMDGQRKEMLFAETLAVRLEKSLDPQTRALAGALSDAVANQRGMQSRFLAALERFDRGLSGSDSL